MIWKIHSKVPGDIGCDYASARLSRFLDNDLASKDATAIAAHLHGCLSCRQEFEGMRAHQALFSALPPPAGGRAARARVLQRLEASVAANQPVPTHEPPAAGINRWQFALVGALAFAAVLSVAGLMHLPPTAAPREIAPIAARPSVVPRQLPASDAIAVMLALHDKQSLVESKPAPAPVRARPRLARARSRTRSRDRKILPATDDRFTRIASKAPADNLALGQGSHSAISAEYLASDDVPEAL